MKNPQNRPAWLAEGITYLLPKSEGTKHPQNYRPITCLPTMYEILTSIVARRMYQYLELTCYQLSKKIADEEAVVVKTNFSSTRW